MKPLLVLVVPLLGLGAIACGDAGKNTDSMSQASSNSAAAHGTPARTASSTMRAALNFKGDEDDDDESGENTDNTNNDDDADFDNDTKAKHTGYYDRDDDSIRLYGRAASPADYQVLTTLVKRYYAAAAASNGTTACSMIASNLMKALPEDYGQSPGPTYLRGAKTCSTVMSLLFKHFHRQMVAAFEVTAVRMDGPQALVLMGSRVQPAGYVSLIRQHGVWKILGLLREPLP